MTGDQSPLQLRQYGVGETEDARPYIDAGAQRDQQVIPNLMLNRAFAVAGGTQFADRLGQVAGYCHALHATTVGRLMREVPSAGQVQRDTGVGGGRRHLVVADRTTRMDDGLHPGCGQDLQTVGEREEGVRGGDGTAHPGPPRSTASRAASTRLTLTHSDSDGRAVGRDDDGIGLHRPTGAPGKCQIGQGHLVGRLPSGQGPVCRVVAECVDAITVLHQQPTADLSEFHPPIGGSAATRTRMFFLRARIATAPSS